MSLFKYVVFREFIRNLVKFAYQKRINLSSSLNDTSSYKLLDFGHNYWVFERCLASHWVFLHITEHLHDAWVSHDVLNLRVGHGVGHSLLVVTARGMGRTVNCIHGLREPSLDLSVIWLEGHGLLPRFHCLVILLLQLMGLGLTNPALREFLVYLDALLGICKGSSWVHKLRVGR